ncbi:MAG: acyl carrier protein [Candidatus Brocadia fulgida]|uniref:Acyl carrier protein n=1 Tax=Candidatus Brocadia fulgida TaxID=380242 RepID=A0A0M2UWN5_9BACT|nr:MAG: acyl carrier protein [Candidatus Brocadia fulgida]
MSGEVVSIDNRVKKVIIERLKPNINVAEISKNTPLIGKGLGLDSVGVLELVVGLEQEFSIMFDDSEMNIESSRI